MGSSADAVPAISFTIPYYDNAGYLAEAIDSVRAQTESDWELIVVDDAGPEPAHDLVAAYGDERITYVRNERNLGLARNWNECLRHVRAPFATVLHGDDRLDPAYAAKVLAAHAAHPDVSIVFTDVRIIGPDGQPARTMADIAKRFARRSRDDHDLAGDGDLAVLLAGNYILCPTLCFRVAVVVANRSTRGGASCPTGTSPVASCWRATRCTASANRCSSTGATPAARPAR